eukprot:961170-Amphidinium_carterae.1
MLNTTSPPEATLSPDEGDRDSYVESVCSLTAFEGSVSEQNEALTSIKLYGNAGDSDTTSTTICCVPKLRPHLVPFQTNGQASSSSGDVERGVSLK